MTNSTSVRIKSAVPFKSNSEYLSACFDLVRDLCSVRRTPDDPDYGPCSTTAEKRKARMLARETKTIDRPALEACRRKAANLKRRADATVDAGIVDLPLVRIAREFGLTEVEASIVATATAYYSRHEIELMIDQATGCGNFNIRAALRLHFPDEEEQLSNRKLFMPASNLISSGVLRYSQRYRWNDMSEDDFLGMNLEMPLSLSSLIQGIDTAGLGTGHSKIIEPGCTLEDLNLPPALETEIRHIAEVELAMGDRDLDDPDEGDPRVVLFYGPPATGKDKVAQAFASLLGKKLYAISTPGYLENEIDSRVDIERTFQTARIFGAVPWFSRSEGLLEMENYSSLADDFADILGEYGSTVIMTANGAPSLGPVGRALTYMVEIPRSERGDRIRMIDSMIPAGTPRADDLDLGKVADSFTSSGPKLRRYVRLACRKASMRSEGERMLRTSDFLPGLGRDGGRKTAKADDLSYTAEPRARLDDVVLGQPQRDTVMQIIRSVGVWSRVFEEWGLAERYATGRGLSALFCGPSGTGKTLTAEAMAGELGKPIRVVQLSGMMDKYVGESEKHIVEVFRSASRNGEVLVIDEADSLFAARVDASVHNSYYINSHINTLLKEMDDFEGIVILTTNYAVKMDPAFERRIRWKVEFPAPDAEARVAIWRKMFPESVPLSPDIDFDALGREFEVSGGSIRSAALKALFIIASEGVPLSMEHLRSAMRSEKLAMKGIESSREIGFGNPA